MRSAATLSEEARSEVARIVRLSRLAGLAVAILLAVATLGINRGNLGSSEFLIGQLVVVLGLIAYVALSTVARQGHARILERSMDEVAQLSEQLRSLAERDALTGLLNQRSFSQVLEEGLGQAQEKSEPLSLVVADLDNFKQLNDAFGHQFGDAVLRDVGRVFAAVCPKAVAARLGGDEFALILPAATRADAVAIIQKIQAELSVLSIEGHETAALGSFGIGTYPADGHTVQRLFTAADGRMYSEKHRRKAQSLATLAGASRQLFVRAGRAMRPDQSIGQVIQEIAAAANEELSLLACVIAVPAHDPHPAISVLEVAPDVDSGQHHIGLWTSGEETSIQAALPPDAWLLNVPIPDDRGNPGRLLLAGLPNRSFRPDAPMAMALADLVHAVVASGRARADASRAGRERDIHNDLAHVLAREGSLHERMLEVTRLIAEFTGATGVSIEGLARPVGEPQLAPSLMFGATSEFLSAWSAARSTSEAYASMLRLAEEGPSVITDVENDSRVAGGLRPLLVGSNIAEIATAPVRFDGEVLALLGAVSQTPDYFTDDLMNVLTAIAEHLAPSMKVALLRDELEASFAELEGASHESLARLADAAEARDPHTAGHLRRIGAASYELARAMGLPEDEARAVQRASAVHDLGKLGLPDVILHKPGRLSDDDWSLMRLHPVQGERLLGESPRFLMERQVARWHHERWDGTGYPDGLQGDDIPLAARIVAVADTLDALTTERSYKPAWALDAACAEILRESGRFYCPTVCAALEQLWSSGRLEAVVQAEYTSHGVGDPRTVTGRAA